MNSEPKRGGGRSEKGTETGSEVSFYLPVRRQGAAWDQLFSSVAQRENRKLESA